jgi:Flp pilus assembly pilin Flp
MIRSSNASGGAATPETLALSQREGAPTGRSRCASIFTAQHPVEREGTDMTPNERLAALVSWKEETGQTMAEYGVVLAVVTLGIVATLGLLAGGLNNAFNSVISFL